MFLFWIFKTKTGVRMPCCLTSLCSVKFLFALFISLQLVFVFALVLHVRGIVDFATFWNVRADAAFHPAKKRPRQFAPNFTSVFQLQDSNISYFGRYGKKLCFIDGTRTFKDGKCLCHQEWYGDECGIPSALWFTRQLQLKPRKKPRRVIHAFPIGSSLDLLEIRLRELDKAVDVYIVAENNRRGHELKLPSVFSQDNWLNEFISRLIYVPKPESHPFSIFQTQILHHLSDVRPDDIVVFSDADEIPSADFITCVKIYDGFPDKLAIYYRPLRHGFYDILDKNSNYTATPSLSLSTINFLLRICHSDGNCLRTYNATGEKTVIIGSPKYPAGWKCTKCDLAEPLLKQTEKFTSTYKFAPEFVLKHKHRFSYLLTPTSAANLEAAHNLKLNSSRRD